MGIERQRLRHELRRLRQLKGLTQRQVASDLAWSEAKLQRIEAGQVKVGLTDMRALLDCYGVADKRYFEDLLKADRDSISPFHQFREVVSRRLIKFAEAEAACASLQAFEPSHIPALLQTKDYARAVVGINSRPDATQGQIMQRVEFRMKRQRLVKSTAAPQLTFLVDESAFRRKVGIRTVGPTLMRDQLRRILALTDHPKIQVKLLPFDAGEYRGMSIPHFTYLSFPDPLDRDAVYVENTAIFQESAGGDDAGELPVTETKLYGALLAAMSQTALNPQESRKAIMRIVGEV